MPKLRVMHFMNQFFGGIGGEDKADASVDFREGPLGPGKRLQTLFGDSAEIVVTAYCGDNYFSEHHDESLEKILQIAREQDVKLLVAGPAFSSGRYGLACVEVCHSVSTSLGLYCITGMHIENPGVACYRQYKDRRIFLFPTAETVTGMENALSRISRFVSKLATGLAIGSSAEEGYISRGFRVVEVASKSGVERAIDMLLDKVAGRSFTTEVPFETEDVIAVTPRITNLEASCLALATTAGVVPQGNPDGFKSRNNDKWSKYPVGSLDTMTDANWEVVHSGYDTSFMQQNPNYGVPLDVCRKIEKEGIFAKLYPYFYASTGVWGLSSNMQRIGRDMVRDMKAEGVDAVLLVST